MQNTRIVRSRLFGDVLDGKLPDQRLLVASLRTRAVPSQIKEAASQFKCVPEKSKSVTTCTMTEHHDGATFRPTRAESRTFSSFGVSTESVAFSQLPGTQGNRH